jgi:hypothetical protein
MDNEDRRKFKMYIHSTLRNVGLFTSLAYGSLAYSRIYRGHNVIYDILLILISMIFIAISFTINLHLYTDIVEFNKKNDKQMWRWEPISMAVMGIHTILLLLSLFTLYRSFT